MTCWPTCCSPPSACCASQVRTPDARLHRVAWFLVTVGSATLALQLAQAWGWIGTGSLDPWYWDRLRGWSENPNQLALLCAMLGLLSLHLADVAASTPARIAAIGAAVLPIYVGRLTKGDAFSLVLVAAGPIFIALKLRTWLLSASTKPHRPLGIRMDRHSRAAAGFCFRRSVRLFPRGRSPRTGRRPGEGQRARHGKNRSNPTSEPGSNAIDRGLESGMLGLGPGPHLPIPALILEGRQNSSGEPKYLEHPEANGTPNFEAHNTLLDIFTQGGLYGSPQPCLVGCGHVPADLPNEARWTDDAALRTHDLQHFPPDRPPPDSSGLQSQCAWSQRKAARRH